MNTPTDQASAQELADTIAHRPAGLLVGAWTVDISFESSPLTERALFAFTSDHLLLQTNTGSKYTGMGVWQQQNRRSFRFAFREQAFDETGAFVFDVHVDHTGTLTSPDTFTSTGTGRAVDANGQVLLVVNSSVSAARYGFDSPTAVAAAHRRDGTPPAAADNARRSAWLPLP